MFIMSIKDFNLENMVIQNNFQVLMNGKCNLTNTLIILLTAFYLFFSTSH